MFGESCLVQLDFIGERVQRGSREGASEDVVLSFLNVRETCGLGICSSCACNSVKLIRQTSVGAYLWQLVILVSLLQGVATHGEFTPEFDAEDIWLDQHWWYSTKNFSGQLVELCVHSQDQLQSLVL